MYQKLSYYPSFYFDASQFVQQQSQMFLNNFSQIPLNQSFCSVQNYFQNSQRLGIESVQGAQTPVERTMIQTSSDKPETKKKSTKERNGKRNFEKEIISAKKNSQSNLINQFFSFFSSRIKSEKKVEAIASLMFKSSTQREKIIMIFYLAMKSLGLKRRKRYINKAILFSMFEPESLTECSELNQKAKNLDISMDDLASLLRRCTTSFLKDFCPLGILTSKRINECAKLQHLRRRRSIISTFLKY